MISAEEDERQPGQRVATQVVEEFPHVRHPASIGRTSARLKCADNHGLPGESWSSAATAAGGRARVPHRIGPFTPRRQVVQEERPARSEQAEQLLVGTSTCQPSAKRRWNGASLAAPPASLR